MSTTQMQQDQSQAYACGRPCATFGSKTASTPDVRVPHHDPAAGWLQGGAPKPTATPGRTAFPRIPEPGLLRVVIYTHFPETNPEESATLDFQDAHLLRLMGKEGCLEYLQAALFGELCARHQVPATPAGCDCCSGRYDGPAPVGRFDPPIGSPEFFLKLEERGVACNYYMCWPASPYRAPPAWAFVPRPPPSPDPAADAENYSAANPEPPANASSPPPAQAVGEESDLAAWVRTGLRVSAELRVTWTRYCDMYEGGGADPAQHSADHIVGFADYLGQLVAADLDATVGPFATPAPQLGASVSSGLSHPGAREPSTLGLYRPATPRPSTPPEEVSRSSP